MSDYFEFESFAVIEQEEMNKFTEKTEKFFDDYHLFDLVEIVILFSKKNERVSVIKRFHNILKEENTNFQILEHMITKKTGETLRAQISLLRDSGLSRKITTALDFIDSRDYLNAAKVSADILNIIFSG